MSMSSAVQLRNNVWGITHTHKKSLFLRRKGKFLMPLCTQQAGTSCPSRVQLSPASLICCSWLCPWVGSVPSCPALTRCHFSSKASLLPCELRAPLSVLPVPILTWAIIWLWPAMVARPPSARPLPLHNAQACVPREKKDTACDLLAFFLTQGGGIVPGLEQLERPKANRFKPGIQDAVLQLSLGGQKGTCQRWGMTVAWTIKCAAALICSNRARSPPRGCISSKSLTQKPTLMPSHTWCHMCHSQSFRTHPSCWGFSLWQ